jgi:hypothetical protein
MPDPFIVNKRHLEGWGPQAGQVTGSSEQLVISDQAKKQCRKTFGSICLGTGSQHGMPFSEFALALLPL